MVDDFIRPGIDDRPDLDKALTPEQKAAVNRLAINPTNTKTIESEAAVENTDRQTARMAETNPSGAIAGRSEVADPKSAFLDMRDPMVAANGSRPSKLDVFRLGAGFTFSLIITGIVWVSLSSILVPQLVDTIAPGQREGFIGLINAVGSVVALIANIVFGTFSDLTRSKFGKRTLWICSGGVLCGLCVFALTFTRSLPLILLLWCGMQLFYNWMNAPFVATLSDRVPDKFRGTVSSFMGAGGVLGQTTGALVGSMLITNIDLGFAIGAIGFAMVGFLVIGIWPREGSNLDEPREPLSVKTVLMAFIPPHGKGARNFYYALFGRLMMVAGYQMITGYQLYIVKYYTLSDSGLNADDLSTKAAGIIATMSVITMVVSLLAAFISGPVSDRLGMRKVPVALSSVLFAIGAAMPWIFRDAMGMFLFAAIAGFGYGVYNAIDQALNVSILPNPAEAGKDLGVLNMSNTLSTVLGSGLTSGLVMMTGGNYALVFPVCIVVVLIAAFLIMRIKNVK
ncbi:MFS transporter [Bifidobacterium oedipodis]|uniref:Transporter, major facilitator family protein n=1 Tax=Bifidobacterium oedipodis TaxID=2675322 RepID=A0A7Y0ER78_9BIFI|nr:MFS transporter [Bifidobacterium sp. DSM 109957]NMM94947.1 transporter, major facilitator family protein [Bifidobacterium sp. DSM 109957]